MSESEILAKLSRILSDLLGEEVSLGMGTRRPEVANWDSFAYVNFIVAVEIEFDLKFNVADVESFDTVGDIVKQIRSLKG